jgi:hypothetical protein
VRNRLTVAAAACSVALIAIGAAPALASRGATKTATTPLAPGSQGSATATCPRRTHSTEGGFIVTPPGLPGGGPASWTQVSNAVGIRSWKVTSGASVSNPSATLTSSVRCERKADGKILSRLISKPTTVAPGHAQTLNFHCPFGSRPIAGAWTVDNPYNGSVDGTSNLIVIQNRRLDRTTWVITSEVRSSSVVSSTFTASALCELSGPRRLVQKAQVTPYVDDARMTGTARCAMGTHVVSGGFAITPLPGANPTPVPFPIMDRNAAAGGRRWRVDLYDTFPMPPAGSALTTYAYCRKNHPARRRHGPGGSPAASSVGSGWVGALRAQPVVTLAG